MATSSVEGIPGIPVFIVVQQLSVLTLAVPVFCPGIFGAMRRSKSMERMKDPSEQALE